ncbi:MAG: MFS transporter [Gammaproteobacteria bacterium]|nr:MFS transporter [Gammaproteobacteria bacterium]
MTKSNPWQTIIPLSCVLFVDAMSYGIVIPVIGPMLLNHEAGILPLDTTLQMRNILYSLVFSLPMLFMFLGAPLLGDLSDYIGRKKALLIALLGITVSCLLSAYGVIIGSILLLLVGRSLLGLMDSSESIAKAAIIDVSKGKYRVINMGLISLAGTLGFVFGPVLGGVFSNSHLSKWFNYETPFIIAALLALLNAVCLVFLFTETFKPRQKKPYRLLQGFENLISAFADKRIKVLSVIFFGLQFVWGLYFQLISIVLVESYHYSSATIGLFMTYLALCFMVTLLIIIRIMLNYLRRITIVLISIVLVMISGFMVIYSYSEHTIWLSVMPISIGIGLSYNTMLSLFSEAVDLDSQGRVMGIATALFASSWLVSSIVGGLLSSIDIHLPYMLINIVMLIILPFVFQAAKPNTPLS